MPCVRQRKLRGCWLAGLWFCHLVVVFVGLLIVRRRFFVRNYLAELSPRLRSLSSKVSSGTGRGSSSTMEWGVVLRCCFQCFFSSVSQTVALFLFWVSWAFLSPLRPPLVPLGGLLRSLMRWPKGKWSVGGPWFTPARHTRPTRTPFDMIG